MPGEKPSVVKAINGSSISTSQPDQAEEERKQKLGKYFKLIQALEHNSLTPLQIAFMEDRWLDQMNWFSREARRYQNRFYWIRRITIVSSILVPLLLSLGSSEGRLSEECIDARIRSALAASQPALLPSPSPVPTPSPVPAAAGAPTNSGSSPSVASNTLSSACNRSTADFWFITGLVLSQLVAVLTGLEQFFKYGDRWRHYRRTAEALKSHGWQFFQLGGAYAAFSKTGGHTAAFPVFAAQVEEIIQSDVEGFVSQIAVQKQLDKQEEKPVTINNISP